MGQHFAFQTIKETMSRRLIDIVERLQQLGEVWKSRLAHSLEPVEVAVVEPAPVEPPVEANLPTATEVAASVAQAVPVPNNELGRLQALERYNILDTLPEEDFDQLTTLAAQICGTPVAAISLISADRQWYKAKVGTNMTALPREESFCTYAILQPEEIMVVPDALEDNRFADNPVVLTEPRIRFYAGAPLVTSDGFALGAICALDQNPRQLTPEQLQALRILGQQTMAQLELRVTVAQLEQEVRDRKRAEAALQAEQEKSERLLLNILPEPIAAQLKQNPSVIAERFESVTILFADIVNFTQLSARIPATQLVCILNDIFSAFDRLAERYDLEKIKTIGDAYMVVGGLPKPRPDHADAIASMALDMQQAIGRFRDDLGQPFCLRIGINTGPIVAGTIGLKKFSYDLWGDAVNIASRMESQGRPGKIQVTEATCACLQANYQLEQRGTIQVKGRGEMMVYFLADRNG